MSELDEIKKAFEAWCYLKREDGMDLAPDYDSVADLFWPFLEDFFRRQIDPKIGVNASEMRNIYRLKKKLGMPLKAHEVTND